MRKLFEKLSSHIYDRLAEDLTLSERYALQESLFAAMKLCGCNNPACVEDAYNWGYDCGLYLNDRELIDLFIEMFELYFGDAPQNSD